jgi:hypothetical protein
MREAFLATLPTFLAYANLLDKSYSCCGIELKPPVDEATALMIGRAAAQAFGREVTLNGLSLEEAPGASSMPWTPWTWPQPCGCCAPRPGSVSGVLGRNRTALPRVRLLANTGPLMSPLTGNESPTPTAEGNPGPQGRFPEPTDSGVHGRPTR